jgi:hypothetical protein
MSDNLVPSTLEDVMKIKSRLVKTDSGIVFRVTTFSAYATAKIMELRESWEPSNAPKNRDEGEDGTQLVEFIRDNIVVLRDECIIPSIIEPKLSPSLIGFQDLIELFAAMFGVTEMDREDNNEREDFREE